MHLIGRRNFLAGLGLGAGSHLLGAIFRRLLPEAQGALVPAPSRYFLFSFASSFARENYTCKARSETDFDLAPSYEPLAPYRKDLVILSSFYNPHDITQHANSWALLSVLPSTNGTGDYGEGSPGGVSIDRFLAQSIGRDDPFPSTLLCTETDTASPTFCDVTNANSGRFTPFSSDGKDKIFPPLTSVQKAYETYFGKGLPADTLAATLAQEQSLLDLIAGDVRRMNTRLGAPERAKLDQYLGSLRAVEKQLGDLAQHQSCRPQPPANPDPATIVPGTLNPARVNASVDITFLAHQCGLTRVSHIGLANTAGASHLIYPGIGDTHVIQHAVFGGPEPAPGGVDVNRERIRQIERYNFQIMARLIKNLAEAQDANGRMLDNSLVMYINQAGGQHHGGENSHPVVLIGRAGGRLRAGRYLTYPEGEHCLSDVYVSIANLLGSPITTFGDPKLCKGALPGLV